MDIEQQTIMNMDLLAGNTLKIKFSYTEPSKFLEYLKEVGKYTSPQEPLRLLPIFTERAGEYDVAFNYEFVGRKYSIAMLILRFITRINYRFMRKFGLDRYLELFKVDYDD